MTDDRGIGDQFDRDDELRALIRRSDPAADLRPADPAAVAALVRDTVRAPEVVPEVTGSAPRRGLLTWIAVAAAAAVVAVAGVGAVAQAGRDDTTSATASHSADVAGPAARTTDAPAAPTASTAPTGAATGEATSTPAAAPLSELSVSSAELSSRCAAPNAAMLASTDAAFSGTVAAISGRRVTLTTGSVLHGSVAPTVTVTSGDFGRLVQTVDFKVGKPYLISAYGGQLAVCGFSGPATGSLQALYAEAFPR